jgi:glucose-1-phosphate adenylyltransferase
MTISIMVGIWLVPAIGKKLQNGMASLANRDAKWADIFQNALFIGMITAFLGFVFCDVSRLWLADENGMVTDLMFNQSGEAEGNFSIGLYVLHKDYLMELVKDAVGHNLTSFERDILQKYLPALRVQGYEITEKAMIIHSQERYFAANLALLDPAVRGALFQPGRPIYTKVRDCSPAKYGLHSAVSNSLVGDGANVNGTVKNSVIFRDVDIAEGAVVENCVIMQGASIGAGTVLRNVIVDKNVVIKSGRSLQGFETYPVYIGKNTIV